RACPQCNGVPGQLILPHQLPAARGELPPLCLSFSPLPTVWGALPDHLPSHPFLSPQSVLCAGGHHCCPRGSHCSADGESCVTDLGMRAWVGGRGGHQGDRMDTGMPHLSPQPPVLSPVLMASPSVLMMPPALGGAAPCPRYGVWGHRNTEGGTWHSHCCDEHGWHPQASCCADKVHCCPHATVCDLTHGRCVSPAGDTDVPLSTAFPAWKRQPPAPGKGCPLGVSSLCPQRGHGDTVCPLSRAAPGAVSRWPLGMSRWGDLLPVVLNAVWLLSPAEPMSCSDGQHCCPQGTSIPCPLCCALLCPTLSQGPCHPVYPPRLCAVVMGSTAVPRAPPVTWSTPPAPLWGALHPWQHCPKVRHPPPQGATAPCPVPGGGTSPDCPLSPARDVKCDEQTSCPDGNTCCRLSSGAWGCCPLEQVCGVLCAPQDKQMSPVLLGGMRAAAVCCPDHVHCCPQGYTCDPEGGSCLQGGGTRRPWVRKTPALPQGGQVTSRNVICDEETSCPDGSTCCRLSLGTWGCCPLEKPPLLAPQAVCCPDHVHCCPQGYTCDPEGGSCLQGGGTRRPWVRKTPALPRGEQVTSGNVKCDEKTSCPDGSTCCRLSLGTWGCCPLEQAVCCRDHQHCCPRGYTCNVATESCEKLLAPTPLVPTSADPRQAPSASPRAAPVPLRATGTHSGGLVPCGATGSCHRGQQCCQARGGSWGCCPFAQGSCCSDGRHCCPAGSRCTRAGWGCSPQRWDLL
ncbi:GRN, partial [Lamprotornis superbus]